MDTLSVSKLDRFLDVCCCFCISSGLLIGLYKLMSPNYPITWAYWCGPALTLLLILLTQNFFRLLLVSIIPSVIVIGLCWETAPAFLDWCRAGFIPFNADFYRSYYLLFHMLPALSITICLWLLIRRRAPFPLLFIGAMVALIAFSAYGIRGQ
ncbi:MAG: hypothetical protein FWF04_01165, partial [Clostridiales bacterium]|nr:hypothetical protein [Clostridiales bacterium]